MSTRVRDTLGGALDNLRYEPTDKRIRAILDGAIAVDTTRAVLLWEPRRIVPSYAVPESDVRADLSDGAAADGAGDVDGVSVPALSERPVLDPSVPFAAHTADGRAVDVRVGEAQRAGAGFRLADADLSGYLVLDFGAFDGWYEEDEPNVGHPRDPFHRIDVLASSRHVVVEHEGELLAESSRPTVLFETMLPPRYYLPREDVRVELVPSDTRSYCAYKGQASYWSPRLGGEVLDDLAWSYEDPLHDAEQVRGRIAFFNERVDLVVDGERGDRPQTPWSTRASASRS